MTYVIPLIRVILHYDDNDNNKAHEECTGDDDVQFHETSAFDSAEWSTSCPGRFTSGEKSWYPLNKRLHRPKSRPGRFREEKNLPAGSRNKDHPAHNKSLNRPGISAPNSSSSSSSITSNSNTSNNGSPFST